MSSKEYLIHINSIGVDKDKQINTFRLTTTKRKIDIGLTYKPLRPKEGYIIFIYPITIKDVCNRLNISLELYNKDRIEEEEYYEY